MGIRTCTRCGDPKDSEQFAWKNKAKGRRHSHCKDCQSGISNKHYQSNRGEYIDRAKKRYHDLRGENEAKLAELAELRGCASCHNHDPEVIEFVHREGEDKKDTVRRLLGQSWAIVQAEILKCDLFCANCLKKSES